MASGVTREEPSSARVSLASWRLEVYATMKFRCPFAPERARERRAGRARELWILRLPFFVLGALGASSCVEDVDPQAAQAAGSSGSGSTAAAGSSAAGAGGTSAQPPAASSGGSAGAASEYMSDPSFGTGTHCPPIQQALLTDFTPPPPAADAGADAGPPPTGASFGDFNTTFSGSTFVYPTGGAYAVHSDTSASNWHLTGTLGNYSGFGITFNKCYLLDASAYRGIAFSVQGNVPMGNSITLNVGIAADDVTSVWLNRNAMPVPEPNAGRCVPAMAQYDGSCGAPNRTIPVTAQVTTVQVLWADLAGGRPAAAVDPKEITNISWNFPPPAGAGTSTPVTYDVDLTIDDLRFIE